MAKSTCGKCKLVFSSLSSFDMHRVGSFGTYIKETEIYTKHTRRCLLDEEMQKEGMRQNKYGHWTCGGDFPLARG